MSYRIENRLTDETGKYAESELSSLLAAVSGGTADEYLFILEADETLPDFAYSVKESNYEVRLTGKTSAEVLTAVYSALEKIGFLFDAAGTHAPKNADFTALRGIDERIVPFVSLRGIRQHVNFPMDISSYRIEDAEEYIKSLARMHMNAITFHSYDGMWTVKPGHFFYNNIHDIPKDGFLSGIIDNKEKYISPECERLYGDEDAVADFAVKFLRRLMHTAKVAGMRVVLSIEPGENPECVISAVNLYPEIDEIELISPEYSAFGFEDKIPVDKARNRAVELFGDSILDSEGWLPGLAKEGIAPLKLADTLDALHCAVTHYRNREAIYRASRELPIRIGLYVLDRGSIYIAKRIMDRILPRDVIFTFLPAHGTEAVVDVVKYMEFEPEDFDRTVIYSWIEFDGNMYIEQNSAMGIYHTARYLDEFTHGKPVYSVCFNHWRTAENRLPISYCGMATERKTSPYEYFTGYAKHFGLAPETLCRFIERAGKFDTYCRDRLFNIGFCFLFCWRLGGGITWCMPYENELLDAAKLECGELIELISECKTESTYDEGRAITDLLVNRYETTVDHFNLISEIVRIRPICGTDRDSLADCQRAEISEILSNAYGLIDVYAKRYIKLMPDRGCEGLIVDYLVTMRGYIEYLRDYYLENGSDDREDAEYAPPPPGTENAKEAVK